MMGPVIIADLRKNSLEQVRLQLTSFNGVDLIDARIFYKKHETGEILPSQKGITLKVDRLPELIEGLQRAEEQARAMGLIGGAE